MAERNPYLTNGPTAIAFSGGRTSAYLLFKILEAHDWKLPAETRVFFENTGKEEELTLKFVNDCSINWGVPITWLEYQYSPKIEPFEELMRSTIKGLKPEVANLFGPDLYKVVTYETASRDGEPFEAVIKKRGGILPNPRSRYCSSEMKTRTMHRFIQEKLGWNEWDTFLGIRADEPSRVSKFRSNPHPELKAETVIIPLAEVGVSAKDVGRFWASNSFDLGLPNIGGKTMHGNCDLCFLKPARQVASLIQEKPQRAVWWAKQEEKAKEVANAAGAYFRNDRPSYKRMMEYAGQQTDMFDPNEEAISCFCGD